MYKNLVKKIEASIVKKYKCRQNKINCKNKKYKKLKKEALNKLRD